MECKICGYSRTPEDTEPEGQCPSCGRFYAKVEKYIGERPPPDEPKEEPVGATTTKAQETGVARVLSRILLGMSWLILLVFLIAAIDDNVLLALVTLPALTVAIPGIDKAIPLKIRAALVMVSMVGIFAMGVHFKHQEKQEMARAAQERQERREQAASERAEFVARFSAERSEIIAAARRDLVSGRPAAVLATAHAWREIDDPALKELGQEALRQAKTAIEAGNVAILEGYTANDFPQFRDLSAQAEKQRAAMASAAEEAACRKDLQCWGDRHTAAVGIICHEDIERLARFAHEWTDGFLEPKFSHFRWKDRNQGSITYVGDKIRFQNGFGAWQPHVYECDFDPETRAVLSVRAEPGRL